MLSPTIKTLGAALIGTTALITPTLSQAREVTLNIEMEQYRGPAAYFAIYLTDPAGNYASTLWLAGTKSKYQRHLRGWARAISSAGGRVDGISGASVGSGRQLSVALNISDALIDAGYTIHVDTAVEDHRDARDAIVAPLSSAIAGQPQTGNGHMRALTVNM